MTASKTTHQHTRYVVTYDPHDGEDLVIDTRTNNTERVCNTYDEAVALAAELNSAEAAAQDDPVAALARTLTMIDNGTAVLGSHFTDEGEIRIAYQLEHLGAGRVTITRDTERHVFDDVTIPAVPTPNDRDAHLLRELAAERILDGSLAPGSIHRLTDEQFSWNVADLADYVRCPPWCAYSPQCWGEVSGETIEHESTLVSMTGARFTMSSHMVLYTDHADYSRDNAAEVFASLHFEKPGDPARHFGAAVNVDELRQLSTLLAAEADRLEVAQSEGRDAE